MEQILAAVKLALRISTDAFNDELNDLIVGALKDLQIAGIAKTAVGEDTASDPLIKRAVITYCKANFGEPDEYERLKASYDEQKAQLQTASGYRIEVE